MFYLSTKIFYSRQANLFCGPEEDLWGGPGGGGFYKLFSQCQSWSRFSVSLDLQQHFRAGQHSEHTIHTEWNNFQAYIQSLP